MEQTSTKNTSKKLTIEEKIIGVWVKDTGYEFTFTTDGFVYNNQNSYFFSYWFEDGYLLESRGKEKYQYSIEFESNDVMLLTYHGYYDDDQWYDIQPNQASYYYRK
jgi:hypothetical protein